MRRGRQDRDEVGFGIVLVIPENQRPDPFAGKRKRTITTHPPSLKLWRAELPVVAAGSSKSQVPRPKESASGTRPKPTPRFVSVAISSSISW